MKPQFKPNEIGSGELRTPVRFFMYQPHDGPEPGEAEKQPIYGCYAEVYSASSKDIEILKSKSGNQQSKVINTKNAVSINIRDTFGEYYPDTEHYAELDDYRFKGIRFNVIDVQPKKNNMIKVLLAVIT